MNFKRDCNFHQRSYYVLDISLSKRQPYTHSLKFLPNLLLVKIRNNWEDIWIPVKKEDPEVYQNQVRFSAFYYSKFILLFNNPSFSVQHFKYKVKCNTSVKILLIFANGVSLDRTSRRLLTMSVVSLFMVWLYTFSYIIFIDSKNN